MLRRFVNTAGGTYPAQNSATPANRADNDDDGEQPRRPVLGELLEHDGAAAAARAPVWRPAYEYSEPITIGGPTGTYQFVPVWDTAYEWTVVQFVANDVAMLAVTTDQRAAAPTGTQTYDPTGGLGRNIVPFATNAATTVPGNSNWFPAGNATALYVQTSVSNSKAAWVVVQLRRRINAAAVPAFSDR